MKKRRDKQTERMCWAVAWGTPCKDFRGQELLPSWRLVNAKGQRFAVCDAHLPEALRRCGLPAQVEDRVDKSLYPPGHSVREAMEESKKEEGDDPHTVRITLPSSDE